MVETITREHGGLSVSMRRVMHLIERTIDRHGQALLMPDIEIEGWLTSLNVPAADIVKLYQGHGTHEQFHSEFKTDLDLERLPSGKFATNDLVLSLAVLAFNILRAIGQATLISPDSPVRYPAKRRGIRTVMQEIIGIAVRVIQHARRLTLGLEECCAASAVRMWLRKVTDSGEFKEQSVGSGTKSLKLGMIKTWRLHWRDLLNKGKLFRQWILNTKKPNASNPSASASSPPRRTEKVAVAPGVQWRALTDACRSR